MLWPQQALRDEHPGQPAAGGAAPGQAPQVPVLLLPLLSAGVGGYHFLISFKVLLIILIQVHSPPGTIIGTVEQEWSIFYPKFLIKDESGEPILKIEGPFCGCECCSDVDFVLSSVANGQEVLEDNIQINSNLVSFSLVRSPSSGQD